MDAVVPGGPQPSTAPGARPGGVGDSQDISTGNKGMDILLKARIDPEAKVPAIVASSVLPRASLPDPVAQGGAEGLSGGKGNLATTAKDWIKAAVGSDKPRDVRAAVPVDRPGPAAEPARPQQAIQYDAPAWTAWPRAVVAVIRENREWVLGLSIATVILIAWLISRQNRAGQFGRRASRGHHRT
jgi:hypothetical protein